MKKILAIVEGNPYPPDDGGKAGVFYMLEGIACQHELHIIMLTTEVVDNKAYNFATRIIKLPYLRGAFTRASIVGKMIHIIKFLTSKYQYMTSKMYCHEYVDFIKKYISENNIDTIFISYIPCAPLIDISYCKEKGIKMICMLHNIEHVYVHETSVWPFPLKQIEELRAKKNEYDTIRKIDLSIAVSDADAINLKRESGAEHIISLPNVLPDRNPKIVWHANFDSDYIIFCGSLYTYPNIEGIRWFLSEVFPVFLKAYPNIKLKITGKVSEKIKKEFSNYCNIVFTGFLNKENLNSEILNSRLEIVPIRRGSGTKIKLVEALSLGVPVVTTEHGAIGIPGNFQDETKEPFLIGRDADDFVCGMNKIFSNEKTALKISKCALNFYDSTYAMTSSSLRWNKYL